MSKKFIKEIIFIGGKNHESYFVNKGSEYANHIDSYLGVLLPYNEEFTDRILLTPEDEKLVFVVSQKRKVSTVLTVEEKDGIAITNEELLSISHAFKGVLILFFHCLEEEDSYHMIYVDSRDQTYKSICFECFGYEKDFVLEIGKVILSASKICIPDELIENNDFNQIISTESNT